MKHLIYIIFILTIFISPKTHSQEKKQDKIKSLKIGYITQELTLTSKEAQLFWPIYNEHQEEIRSQHEEIRKLRKEIRKNGGIDILTNSQAENVLQQFATLDKKIAEAEIEMYENMKTVLSAKKILKLKLRVLIW